MKIGTDTGSMMNHLMSRMTQGQPTPEAGMAATLLSWTDRRAATIARTWVAGVYTYVEVVEDRSTVVEGGIHDGSAVYDYQPNPDGYRQTFRMRSKGGPWTRVTRSADTGRWHNSATEGLMIGKRETYRDPSF